MSSSRALAPNHALGRADHIVQDIRVSLRNGGLKAFLEGTDTRIADAQHEVIGLRYSSKHYGLGLIEQEMEKYSKAISDEMDLALAQSPRTNFRFAGTHASSVEVAYRKV